jgi:diguanylate cyclase (GGDEF)-like protein
VVTAAVERRGVRPEHHPSGERRASKPSWLCPDDADRERMLDMEDRVRPCRQRTLAILAVAIASVAPWLGWWPLLFLIPSAAFFATAEYFLPRVARPELVMFAAWIGSELAIAGAVALEGGPRSAALCWLAIPVITLSSRFSMPGVLAGVTIASALVLAVAFGVHPQAVLHSPDLVVAPLALVLSVAVLSTPLMRSDIQHRSDAVIDQLTGMLNRKALGARVHELRQQSEVTGEPIGVIVADLDHFKRINDTFGHGAGDRVLRRFADMLRAECRQSDVIGRLGGEEFGLIAPETAEGSAAQMAGRIRDACRRISVATPLGAAQCSCSIGITQVTANDDDIEAVLSRADAALYEAKRSGRDSWKVHALVRS